VRVDVCECMFVCVHVRMLTHVRTQELRRGVAQDCWQAAVIVGRSAVRARACVRVRVTLRTQAIATQRNFFEAYAMCPLDLCDDGCR
jgi:hypothetical protein